MRFPSGASALSSASTTTCTTFARGHHMPLPLIATVRKAGGWTAARVLLGDGKMLMLSVGGDPRWFHSHDVAGIADIVTAVGDTVRYHPGHDVLEVGGRMFSLVPLAESLTAELLGDC